MPFWTSALSVIQRMLAIRSLVPLSFLNSAWTSGSSWFMKPSLENFEHYFASRWDECNCAVLWAFYGIGFLWDWNENWLFPVCGHCWVFQICWNTECSTFTASSFRIWNSPTGIPSPPQALFIVMLPKTYLTLHSVCPLMDEGKRLVKASWGEVLAVGQTGSCYDGPACAQ